jgi:hypothetical protein
MREKKKEQIKKARRDYAKKKREELKQSRKLSGNKSHTR